MKKQSISHPTISEIVRQMASYSAQACIMIICILALLSVFSTLEAQPPDPDLFLKPTPIIDSDHPAIIKKAKELTRGAGSIDEKIQALFQYINTSYSNDWFETYKASQVLKLRGNSCHRRSNLLAALARAVNIPSRLHLQVITVKNFKYKSGKSGDMTFTHGITGLKASDGWHLYEPVANKDKWAVWVQDKNVDPSIIPRYRQGADCLFKSTEKVLIKTLPIYFVDHNALLLEVRENVLAGKIGFIH